jgi:hypothetical protein
VIVHWEPKKYLNHFGSVDKIALTLGIQPRSVHQQIKKKKINVYSLAYLNSQMGLLPPIELPAYKVKPKKKRPNKKISREKFEPLVKSSNVRKEEVLNLLNVDLDHLNSFLLSEYGTLEIKKIRPMIRKRKLSNIKANPKTPEWLDRGIRECNNVPEIAKKVNKDYIYIRRRLMHYFNTSNVLDIKCALNY